jgi:hypothetical protein
VWPTRPKLDGIVFALEHAVNREILPVRQQPERVVPRGLQRLEEPGQQLLARLEGSLGADCRDDEVRVGEFIDQGLAGSQWHPGLLGVVRLGP